MGESRNELLKWINDTCSLNLNKLEQAGTGAAYCQIIDSIYRDIPLKRVKFNAKSEIDYLDNFKILTNSFNKHKIDKIIPTLDLIKLRMQDNLLFIQWLKRYWDANYPGGEYDALKRRGASTPSKTSRPSTNLNTAQKQQPVRKPTTMTSKGQTANPVSRTPINNNRVADSAQKTKQSQIQATNRDASRVKELEQKLADLTEQTKLIQDEREFYFSKLQHIEEFCQAQQSSPGLELKEVLSTIENILYATQEGYAVSGNAPNTNPDDEGLDELDFPEDENMELENETF